MRLLHLLWRCPPLIALPRASPHVCVCSYTKTNAERRHWQRKEHESAQAKMRSNASRRATAAALKAQRDDEKIAMDELVASFCADKDLFHRGVENFVIYHNRKLGRHVSSGSGGAGAGAGAGASKATQPPMTKARKAAATAASSYGASSSSSSSAGAASGSAGDEGGGVKPPLGAAHIPPPLPPPANPRDAAPGSINNPLGRTAKEDYLDWKAAEEEAGSSDSEGGYSGSGLVRKKAGAAASNASAVHPAHTLHDAAAELYSRFGADDILLYPAEGGGKAYLRLTATGARMPHAHAPPLLAAMPAEYVLPDKGTKHHKMCKLCNPQLLEDEVYGRNLASAAVNGLQPSGSGTEAAASAAFLATAAIVASLNRKKDVPTPHFKELSILHLQGIRYDTVDGAQGPSSATKQDKGGGGGSRSSSASAKVTGKKRRRTSVSSAEDSDGAGGAPPPAMRSPAPYRKGGLSATTAAASSASVDSSGFPVSRSLASPAVIIGVDGFDNAGSRSGKKGGSGSVTADPKYAKLSKLSRELGVALAVDPTTFGAKKGKAGSSGSGSASSSSSAAAASAGGHGSASKSSSSGGKRSASRSSAMTDEDSEGEDADDEGLSLSERKRASAASAASSSAASSSASSAAAATALPRKMVHRSASRSAVSSFASASATASVSSASASGGAGAGASQQALVPNPALDAHGYTGSISKDFWLNFTQQRAAINNHGDVVPAIIKALQKAEKQRAMAGVTGAGSSGGGGGAAAATPSGAGGGGPGSRGGAVSQGSFAFMSPTAASGGSLPPVPHLEDDRAAVEKWLIRRRLHYCETHVSDCMAESPIDADFLLANPLAPYLTPLVEADRAKKGIALSPAISRISDVAAAATPAPLSAAAGLLAPGSLGIIPGSGISAAGRGRGRGRGMLGRPGLLSPTAKGAQSNIALAFSLMRGESTPGAATPASKAGGGGSRTGSAGKGRSGAGRAFIPPFEPRVLGETVDVQDDRGSWWLATIVDVAREGGSSSGSGGGGGTEGTVTSVKVHYQGWHEDFDEWVAVPSTELIEAIQQEGVDGKHLSSAVRAGIAASRILPAGTRSKPASNVCCVCDNAKSGDLLFCDHPECGRAYHLQCTKPQLKKVPSGTWYCALHRKADGGSSSGSGSGEPSAKRQKLDSAASGGGGGSASKHVSFKGK